MSNELNFTLGITGQTVIARLYQGGAVVGSNISIPEVASQGGFYSGNMPAVAAGKYDVQFLVGGAAKGGGSICWDGTKEVTQLNLIADYRVRTIVETVTTSGNTAHIKAYLLTPSEQIVDLSVLDPDATCTVQVVQDGNVPLFTLSTSDMGVPNALGYFEADFTNPNFTTDCGYTVLTTIVADGVTYADRVDSFNVWA